MKAQQTEQARIAAALDELATVQAALRLWVVSLPEEDTIDANTASPYQLSMRAIDHRLDTAKDAEPGGSELLFASGLVAMLEGALWQQSCGLPPGAVNVDDLRRTAELALHHLASGVALLALNAEGAAP